MKKKKINGKMGKEDGGTHGNSLWKYLARGRPLHLHIPQLDAARAPPIPTATG